MISVGPLIGLILLFSLLPFILSVFVIEEFSFIQMIEIARDASMRISMGVSLLYAYITIALSLGIGMRFAFRIYHLKDKYQNIFLFFLFLAWMIPAFISVPIYRSILYWFTETLVENRFFAFSATCLIRIWINIPITTLIAYASIKNTPNHQIEMMRMEGANKEQTYNFLLNPLTRSILLSFSIILLINSLREFSIPLMLTNGRPYLMEGFTSYGISGSTTTLGLFLKDSMFRLNADFIAYSQSLFVSLFILLVFFSIRKLRTGRGSFLFIAPLLDCFLFCNWPSAIGFLIFSLLFFTKRLNRLLLLIPLILTSFMIEEISPGLLLLVLLFFFIKKRLFAFRLLKKIWNKVCDVSVLIWLLITILIVFNFIKLAFSDPLYIPDWNEFPSFTIGNFAAVFSDGFQINLINSTFIGLMSALLTLLIVFPAAYQAVLKKRMFSSLISMIILSMVLTGMNTIVPLFLIFRLSGLIDTLFGVILIVVNHAIPIAFLIAYEDIRKIPLTHIDHAKIEGASTLTTFLKVIFPQILPVSLIVFIKVMIDGWSSFTAPLIFISSQDKYPVSLRLYTYAGKDAMMYPQWGKFAAGSLISLLILFLMIFPLRRVLFKGVYRSWSDEQI
ncbi:MAG: ABC transporter permease subunit [Thermotogota bacterium]|nr:ABC transporter permease subunit [Thermotogota bacterium]